MVKSALTSAKSTKKTTTKKAAAPKKTATKAAKKSKATTKAAETKRAKCPVGEKKSKKGCKPKRDPNKPKRAGQPYIYFCQEERPKIKAANPSMTAPDILKECGKAWQKAKEGDISKWTKMAEKDKVRYTAEMAKYKSGIANQKEESAEASDAEESAN